MRFLTDDEQAAWRGEYQQKEDEVQKNIAVYLSALVVVIGWVFSPQAKPVIQTVLGNDGLNVIGILILLGINAIFASFLIYKSIQIHEITQFITQFSPVDSPSQYWEHWRRSEHSLSKRLGTRILYMTAIGSIPFWVSVISMIGSWYLIHQNPKLLASELLRTKDSSPKSVALTVPVTPALTESQTDSPEAFTERVSHNLKWGRDVWWAIAGLHSIPLLFVVVSWPLANKEWREIQRLVPLPNFGDLSQLRTLCAAPQTASPSRLDLPPPSQMELLAEGGTRLETNRDDSPDPKPEGKGPGVA